MFSEEEPVAGLQIEDIEDIRQAIIRKLSPI